MSLSPRNSPERGHLACYPAAETAALRQVMEQGWKTRRRSAGILPAILRPRRPRSDRCRWRFNREPLSRRQGAQRLVCTSSGPVRCAPSASPYNPVVPTYLEVCEVAVRRAGAVLLDRFGRIHARQKGPRDLVTEADLAAQEVVRATLQEAFPTHALVGEEDSPASVNSRLENDFRWIVDPLDGTTNYVHRVPFCCVSLALEHRGRLLASAVFNPFCDECFTAASGQGAALNGVPIHASQVRRLSEALVAAGFPAAVSPESPDLRVFNEVVVRCQGIRRTGSAALNLAYVAAGRFDAAWACTTKVWDSAAGTLLIREAGGMVSSIAGEEVPLPDGPFVVAATPDLHRELVAIVQKTLPVRHGFRQDF